MKSLGKIAAIAVTALAAALSPASAFPEKPVTFIVPFAAGGSTDVVARIMADHMSRTLGQQIVIETVVGAGGTIGTARVAKAAPDGYTVVVGSLGPNVAATAMYASLPYDPIRDFEPVIMSVQQPMVVITRKDLPVATFREFVSYLKVNASKLNYGSGGVGAQSHLTCAYLSELTGTTPQHVPFRGSAPVDECPDRRADRLFLQQHHRGGAANPGQHREAARRSPEAARCRCCRTCRPRRSKV